MRVIETLCLTLDCTMKIPQEVEEAVRMHWKKEEVYNKIVLLRLFGTLKSGSVQEINLKEIFKELYDRGAFFVMKNMYKLFSPEFEEVKMTAGDKEQIEDQLLREHSGGMPLFATTPEQRYALMQQLMKTLSLEKQEGETNAIFEKRLMDEMEEVFKGVEKSL